MTILQTIKGLKWDENGLIPAIVQDAVSKDVLMMAYMNAESLRLTIESKETWFWSRSRQELWHKGATSSNTQQVTDLRYDCDADSLLVFVTPQGPACHTGQRSCYFNHIELDDGEKNETQEAAAQKSYSDILSVLETLIAERDAERPEGAYTTYLFEQGIDKILKKVGEESAEVIIAAKNKDNEELRNEASDLIYHLMVLLRAAELPFEHVLQVLESRHNKKG